MSQIIADPGSRPTLREQAQQHLAAGTAPTTRGWGVGVEALTLLHRLASSPASAADALKLLHELQVHQVELDLQQAQIEANEHELAVELARYRALYEEVPIAHYVLDTGGRIVTCNRAGADLFGTRLGEVAGRRFDEFLSNDSRLSLAALLRDVRGGAAHPCCTVRPAGAPNDSRQWRITASTGSASDAVQLIIVDAGSPDG